MSLKILGHLLHPFFQYCQKTQKRYIEVHIQAYIEKPLYDAHPYYRLGYETDPPQTPPTLLKGSWLDYDGKKQHPRRLSNYHMIAYPANIGGRLPWRKYDWKAIRMVQQLSNINCRLKQELGLVFWENVHLTFKPDSDFEKLRFFLAERPATHAGIRSVSVELSIRYEGSAKYIQLLQPGLSTFDRGWCS